MVYWLHANTGQQVDGTGLVYLRARYYSGAFGRFLGRDVWEGDANEPLSFNAWLYVGGNPVNLTDPSGMFVCSPMPTCQEWILHALAQLDVSGGDFSRLVTGLFWTLDRRSGSDRLRVDFNARVWGTSWRDYYIQMLRDYIQDPLPVPGHHVALFVHEIVHQTQTWQERMSTWGEAQAYVFQAKVEDEMHIGPTGFLAEIFSIALDMTSFGFTTHDPDTLRRVKGILLSDLQFNWWYMIEPILPSFYGRADRGCDVFAP